MLAVVIIFLILGCVVLPKKTVSDGRGAAMVARILKGDW